MKLRQGILLAVIILAVVPILSACEQLELGGSSEYERQREHYEQQLEAYRKVQESNRQQQEAYNKQLAEGLKQWSEAYDIWLKQQQEQQLKQLEETQTD
ncbi:hypothetical protein ACFLXF_02320 [Chloroflexota bacterium]